MVEKMVESSDLMPNWFEKYKGITKELDDQLLRGLRTPGEGLTLDHLQALVEHRDPFAAVWPANAGVKEIISKDDLRLLLKSFGKIAIDPLPEWFTEENLARAATFNLRPIFLPGEKIYEGRLLRNWKMPSIWFYEQIRTGKIGRDSDRLLGGWHLADFTSSVNFDGGRQVFCNDPLAPIIAGCRQRMSIGRHPNTPIGSRFAILPESEWSLVFVKLAGKLGLDPWQIRLERAIEFNAIGNLYDANRGQFTSWEWFADAYDAPARNSGCLFGGARDEGGLASVHYGTTCDRGAGVAGRPLIRF
jgi:hypothetical protein